MKALYARLLAHPSAWLLVPFVLVSLAFNLWSSDTLTQSYAASRFPVPYFVAQLSFSAEQLKGWYAALQSMGTFDVYVRTQHIDSLFIVSTLMLHGGVLLLISRLFAAGSRGRKWMVIAALLSAIAPISDQLENLVSYWMLANPVDFAAGWAYVYSSFAATKFAFFVFAYVVAPLGLLVGLVNLGLRLRRA